MLETHRSRSLANPCRQGCITLHSRPSNPWVEACSAADRSDSDQPQRDCSTNTTSVLVGEEVRLDAEIDGLSEQRPFPFGIRAVCAVKGGPESPAIMRRDPVLKRSRLRLL